MTANDSAAETSYAFSIGTFTPAEFRNRIEEICQPFIIDGKIGIGAIQALCEFVRMPTDRKILLENYDHIGHLIADKVESIRDMFERNDETKPLFRRADFLVREVRPPVPYEPETILPFGKFSRDIKKKTPEKKTPAR